MFSEFLKSIQPIFQWDEQGRFIMTRGQGQQLADLDRKFYEITFPHEMTNKNVEAFIRSIGSNLRSRNQAGGVATTVFETRASAEGGFTHRIGVPTREAAYLVGQLQHSLPGIDVTELHGKDDPGFQFAATLHMHNPAEELPVANTTDFSHRILASMQDAVREHDSVAVQWIIAHSENQEMPANDEQIRTKRTSKFRPNNRPAGRDEITSRRNKQADQNYVAVCRIGAKGETVQRAQQLVGQVVRAFTSERGSAYLYPEKLDPQAASKIIKNAITPMTMTSQLSTTEVAAVIGWPMGDQYIPGLQRGSTRHMPAPESVPRTGRILGKSTMPGLERQIAMSHKAALTHTYIAGGTGVGKTTLMVNAIRQDMETGAGIILIEREGNLFQQALDQVPPERMDDVICIDLSRDSYPIGLNLLRTNKPEIVASQFGSLLEGLFPDSAKGINASQITQNGVPVLANLERATLYDLMMLADPTNPAEKAWALDAAAKHPDKLIRDFWLNDWFKRDPKVIAKDVLPFKNRMRELFGPLPIRYLLNQETSSFDPLDVINGNKLLFVNLAGVSEQAASLIGTMLVTAIWTAAVRGNPDKPNFMYLDEFQQFTHLNRDFEDMLATARRQKLGLVIATQYIERLPKSMQDAVMANARTKIIFQSSSNSSHVHATDFASNHVRRESFMNLKAHDAIARINTETGISEPVTLHTYPEPTGFHHAQRILSMSAQRYGRTKQSIDLDDSTRRIVRHTQTPETQPDFGPTEYNPE